MICCNIMYFLVPTIHLTIFIIINNNLIIRIVKKIFFFL
jgi:hypothetical protein